MQLLGSQFSKHALPPLHACTRAHARARTRFHIQKCHCRSQFGKKHIRCGGDEKGNGTGEVGQKGGSSSCLHGNGPGRSGTGQSGQEKIRGCGDSLAGSRENRASPPGRISSSAPGLQAAVSGWSPQSPPSLLLEWHFEKLPGDQQPRSFLPYAQSKGCAQCMGQGPLLETAFGSMPEGGDHPPLAVRSLKDTTSNKPTGSCGSRVALPGRRGRCETELSRVLQTTEEKH